MDLILCVLYYFNILYLHYTVIQCVFYVLFETSVVCICAESEGFPFAQALNGLYSTICWSWSEMFSF